MSPIPATLLSRVHAAVPGFDELWKDGNGRGQFRRPVPGLACCLAIGAHAGLGATVRGDAQSDPGFPGPQKGSSIGAFSRFNFQPGLLSLLGKCYLRDIDHLEFRILVDQPGAVQQGTRGYPGVGQ